MESPLVGHINFDRGIHTEDEATPFAETIAAPLFNGNGWANSSLIQSEPLWGTYAIFSSSIKNTDLEPFNG